MPRHLQVAIVATLMVFPALAGVEDEWNELYTKAQRFAAAKQFAIAENFYNKALQKAELFGPNDVRVGSTLEGLSLVLRAEKKLTQAEDAMRRSVAIFMTSRGDDSVEYAQSQLDLARILLDEGKYESALQSTKILLPIFDGHLDSNDNQLAVALCLQGDVFRMLKLYASAETPLRRCAEIQADAGDLASPAFGEAANSLALVYQHLGNDVDADRYFTYAEKIREKTLGLLSPDLAETLEAHAALLHQLGRDADAKTKERMAAAIRSHAARK